MRNEAKKEEGGGEGVREREKERGRRRKGGNATWR
jgi:hypothetical protein